METASHLSPPSQTLPVAIFAPARRHTMLRLLIAVFAFSTLSQSGAAAEPALVWPDREHIGPAREDIVDGKEPLPVTRVLEIGNQTRIDLKFSITTKGNGGLALPGLLIRVHDEHSDGITFAGGLLRCEWRDEDSDGFLDLVVGGWADHADDRERKVKSVPLRAVFRYHPDQRRFEPLACPPEIYYQQLKS